MAILRAAVELFKQQLADRYLRRLRGHVVVCGLGRKGFHLVQQLREHGDRVVVIEIDEGDDELATLHAMGVPVLIGDATSGLLLRRAGVPHAARLIAVCREDSINIEIALQGRTVVMDAGREANDPLICHVHIIDLKLAELFRQHKIFSCSSDPFEARIFSFYENSARDFLLRHPLDPVQGNGAAHNGVHLVVVGFGQMGEGVALQAARVGHFASGRKLRISVLDPQADERRLNLLSRYPQIEQVVELEFFPQSIEHPVVRERLAEWATRGDERLVVAICLDDDPRALSIALNLPPALQAAKTPIYVRQSEQRGLAALIDERAGETSGWNVTSFGEPEVAAGREQILAGAARFSGPRDSRAICRPTPDRSVASSRHLDVALAAARRWFQIVEPATGRPHRREAAGRPLPASFPRPARSARFKPVRRIHSGGNRVAFANGAQPLVRRPVSGRLEAWPGSGQAPQDQPLPRALRRSGRKDQAVRPRNRAADSGAGRPDRREDCPHRLAEMASAGCTPHRGQIK